MSGLTLGSRVLGMVRDAVIAMTLGGGPAADLFFLAFRPFDLLRKMFANGFLTLSFIPVFSNRRAGGRSSDGVAMVSSCLAALSLAGLVVLGLGLIGADWVAGFIVPDTLGGDGRATVAALFKFMLPYVWMIMAVSLASAVLQCLGNFHLPALAPSLFNGVVIAAALGAGKWAGLEASGLALGVTLGGMAQLILVFPRLLSMGMVRLKGISMAHPGVVEAGRKMLPAMVGSGSFHVNIVVASIFAGYLSPGSVSSLYFADRLVQFPMGLIAVSLSTVLLPTLSRQLADRRMDLAQDTFEQGLRLGIFVTLPAMAGLMALAHPVVELLFARGAFGADATARTGDCLFVLASGLWAMTGTQLLSTLHFGRSRMKQPFRAGLIAMGMNLILCPILGPAWGAKGLALSVALSAMGACLFLVLHPPGGQGGEGLGKAVLESACRALFLSVIMFFLVRHAASVLIVNTLGTTVFSLGILGCILLGAGFVFGAGWWMARGDVRLVLTLLKRK
ncbi:MAG: murein biosynthesis integral membrane protein MurJ [Desulfobacterales bacterium]|nr:murein biosynthesis integral membrane protein MurJ [Desulfobacterales bacterium]